VSHLPDIQGLILVQVSIHLLGNLAISKVHFQYN